MRKRKNFVIRKTIEIDASLVNKLEKTKFPELKSFTAKVTKGLELLLAQK